MEKGRGEQGKAVLIADQPELKVTVIFALLILVPLHKKDLDPQPLKRFEEVRFCSWKSVTLLSSVPTEETTNNPLVGTSMGLGRPKFSCHCHRCPG